MCCCSDREQTIASVLPSELIPYVPRPQAPTSSAFAPSPADATGDAANAADASVAAPTDEVWLRSVPWGALVLDPFKNV